MFNIRNTLIAGLAAMAVAVTYVDVLNDLKQTDSDVNTLTGQINAYTGTGAQTLAARNQVKKIQADLDKALSDTNSATVPSAADASTVYSYVCVTPLYPDVTKALNAAKAKKATFSSAGVLVEFCGYTKDLKARTDKLADALVAKAPNSDLKTKGAACKANYDAAFDSAITTLGC